MKRKSFHNFGRNRFSQFSTTLARLVDVKSSTEAISHSVSTCLITPKPNILFISSFSNVVFFDLCCTGWISWYRFILELLPSYVKQTLSYNRGHPSLIKTQLHYWSISCTLNGMRCLLNFHFLLRSFLLGVFRFLTTVMLIGVCQSCIFSDDMEFTSFN